MKIKWSKFRLIVNCRRLCSKGWEGLLVQPLTKMHRIQDPESCVFVCFSRTKNKCNFSSEKKNPSVVRKLYWCRTLIYISAHRESENWIASTNLIWKFDMFGPYNCAGLVSLFPALCTFSRFQCESGQWCAYSHGK